MLCPFHRSRGGLVLAGRAPLGGVPGSAITQPVEGIQDTTYGGTDPADSSGVLRHVRIWHPGYVVADGNELNGTATNIPDDYAVRCELRSVLF